MACDAPTPLACLGCAHTYSLHDRSAPPHSRPRRPVRSPRSPARTRLKGAPRRLHRDALTAGQWQAQQGLACLLQVLDALEHRDPQHLPALPAPSPDPSGSGSAQPFLLSAPSLEERQMYDAVRAHVQARQPYTPRMQAQDTAAIHSAPAPPPYSFDGRGIHLAAQDLAATLDRYFHPVMWPECATSTT